MEYFTDQNNLNKLDNISYMFSVCKSLKYLPDISKWNIENVTNMQNIFEYCSALLSLPEISAWNTNKVKYMKNLFKDCKLLVSLMIYQNAVLIILLKCLVYLVVVNY